MTLDDLRQDLSHRLGRRVETLLTRDGQMTQEIADLYQPSPAGFGGRLRLQDGTTMAWELWLEDGESWNFHVSALAQ